MKNKKIKDGVSLEKLKEFGFRNIDSFGLNLWVWTKGICDVIVITKTREIKISEFIKDCQFALDQALSKIKELKQAGLVEDKNTEKESEVNVVIEDNERHRVTKAPSNFMYVEVVE